MPIEPNKNEETVKDFIAWRDKLHREVRGGKIMFDVPKHYKWLDEEDLFTYYMDIVLTTT